MYAQVGADGSTLATAATQAASGNFLGSALSLVKGFAGRFFGGQSKADSDREAKVQEWISSIWPQMLTALQTAIDPKPGQDKTTATAWSANLEKNRNTPLPESMRTGLVTGKRMTTIGDLSSNLWDVYVWMLQEHIKITQDASRSKTDASTRIDQITGNVEGGPSVFKNWMDLYNWILNYGAAPEAFPYQSAPAQAPYLPQQTTSPYVTMPPAPAYTPAQTYPLVPQQNYPVYGGGGGAGLQEQPGLFRRILTNKWTWIGLGSMVVVGIGTGLLIHYSKKKAPTGAVGARIRRARRKRS